MPPVRELALATDREEEGRADTDERGRAPPTLEVVGARGVAAEDLGDAAERAVIGDAERPKSSVVVVMALRAEACEATASAAVCVAGARFTDAVLRTDTDERWLDPPLTEPPATLPAREEDTPGWREGGWIPARL